VQRYLARYVAAIGIEPNPYYCGSVAYEPLAIRNRYGVTEEISVRSSGGLLV
jgi:hypothetical protein